MIGLDPKEWTQTITNDGEHPITIAMTDGWRPYGFMLAPGETVTLRLGPPIGWSVPSRGSFARIGLEMRVHVRRIIRAITR